MPLAGRGSVSRAVSKRSCFSRPAITSAASAVSFIAAVGTAWSAGLPSLHPAKIASQGRNSLPDVARESPLPLIVVAHPSEGVADGCAPSKKDDALREVALPWAARGYAVIATDDAGLGNAKTQGYLDNEDSAHSLLDSARALRKLVAPGQLSSQIVLVGYSQGERVVLSAQGLSSAYGSGGQVSGGSRPSTVSERHCL